jgi:hypothetical protein
MEWRRGFFRLWLLLSAVWVAALACASTGRFAGNDDALFNTLNAGIEWRGPKGGRSPPPCQRIEVLPIRFSRPRGQECAFLFLKI